MNSIKVSRSGRGESLYSEHTGRFVRLILEKPEQALEEYGFNFVYSIDESDSAAFLKNIGIESDSWRQRFLEAVALHRRGELKNAEKVYKELLSEDGKHKEIEYNLAALYLQSGEEEKAKEHLGKFEKFVSSIEPEENDAVILEEFTQRIKEIKEELE